MQVEEHYLATVLGVHNILDEVCNLCSSYLSLMLSQKSSISFFGAFDMDHGTLMSTHVVFTREVVVKHTFEFFS